MADRAGEALLRPRRRRESSRAAQPRIESAVPSREEKEKEKGKKEEKPLLRLNCHSAFWILASIAITYYVEFFKTIKEIIQKESGWFFVGSCLLVVSLSVASYCIIYLEWYHGIADYEESHPALIPITTASFIAAAICFNVSLWPVWSFLTPVVLFVQFMGVVMLVSLLG